MSTIPVAAAPVVPFRVDVQPDRDVVYVMPVGELDMATVGRLADELGELRAAGFAHVVLDLRGLQFMDSSASHLILEANAAAQQDGRHFALIPGSPMIQRVFEITGLTAHLQFEQR